MTDPLETFTYEVSRLPEHARAEMVRECRRNGWVGALSVAAGRCAFHPSWTQYDVETCQRIAALMAGREMPQRMVARGDAFRVTSLALPVADRRRPQTTPSRAAAWEWGVVLAILLVVVGAVMLGVG
jgi:hypothetical protein